MVNGRFEYKRAKTGKLYSIKVEPEAQDIIEKYKGKDYLLNIMDEYGNYKDFLHRMGIGLKQIGETERKGLGGKKSRNPLFPLGKTHMGHGSGRTRCPQRGNRPRAWA